MNAQLKTAGGSKYDKERHKQNEDEWAEASTRKGHLDYNRTV
ncbi:MAG: hypothetical protein ACFUZC_02910 [Chthoniobacteraceae bacterium]